MEHSIPFGESREHAGEDEDLEEQLAAVERRYAHARERARRARDECHSLEADIDTRINAVKYARERYDAAEAKCLHLKRLIEQIEERLD